MSVNQNAQAMLPSSAGVPSVPSTTTGAGSGPSMGPADVMRILKQRKLLIIMTFVPLYLLIVGATIVTYRFWPKYSNTARIEVIPPPATWGEIKREILPGEHIKQLLTTKASMLLSPQLLMDVLAQPEVKETEFYKWYSRQSLFNWSPAETPEDAFNKCLADLQDLLKIGIKRDSSLIEVTLQTKNKSEARLLVNEIARQFIEETRQSGTEEGIQRLDVLKKTWDEVDSELRNTQSRKSELLAEKPAIEEEMQVLTANVSMLENTRAELMVQRTDLQAQLSTLRGIDPRNLPLSAEQKLIIEADPLLRYYQQQVEALEMQMSIWQEHQFGAEHRVMQLVQSQRRAYRGKEMARRQQLIADLRERQEEMLRQEVARIQRLLDEVGEQLAMKMAAQQDAGDKLLELKKIEVEEDRLGAELEAVSLKMREAETQLGVQREEGEWKMYPAIRDPILPSQPNLVIWLGGGLVLSGMIAVGLAFLREMTDQAIRTPIDVARHGRLSVLGSVPLLDDEEADVDDIEVATRYAPQSLVAESYRQIRAHLTFSGPLESQKALLLTSPRPEDGKTATAINLAVSFAQSNQRVLLIDCNFRRPAIKEAFEHTRVEGLSNVLVGRMSLRDTITQTELPNLHVLTSGPMPPNPAELLGSQQMRDLISEAKQSYDRVLFDGPPCLLISDALVLATQLDAVVMVTRAASNSKGALRRAREKFHTINVRVIGAVLNGVQARPGGYFRQQYREFYDYTNEEVVPQELPGGAPPEIEAGDDDFGGLEDEKRK